MNSYVTGLCVLLTSLASSSGATIYVDASLAAGSNDGTSWTNAFRGRIGLQAALTAAQAGDEIWVANGTYAPASAGGARSTAFELKSNVNVLGGFAGNETDRDQRNPAANIVILTADLSNNDLPNGSNTSDNSFNVLRAASVTNTLLDGLTIRDGQADGTTNVFDRGAGLFISAQSTLQITRCRFIDNRARFGGGMAIANSTPTVSQCEFNANTGNSRGGGVYHTDRSAATFQSCRFEANIGGEGAGFFNGPNPAAPDQAHCAPTIHDCTFFSNVGQIGSSRGPGLLDVAGTPDIRRCTFDFNRTGAGGGGMYLESSAAFVESCTFTRNQGINDGGDAIYVGAPTTPNMPQGHPIFVNCVIKAHGDGAANNFQFTTIMINFGALAHFINCTIANNHVLFNGGATIIVQANCAAELENCILWGNTGSTAFPGAFVLIRTSVNASVFLHHCLAQDWAGQFPSDGTSGADPLFVDADGPDNIIRTLDDNVHISASSPAIDHGDTNHFPVNITLDLDGNPRIIDDPSTVDTGHGGPPTIDSGAYEFVPPPPVCPGDSNNDQSVNAADLSVLLGQFGQSVTAGTGADFNSDGVVNAADLSILLSNFGNAC